VAVYSTNSYRIQALAACPDDCSSHGQCVNGRCVCDSGYDYPNCWNDDLHRLRVMLTDFNTSGLDSTLGWLLSDGGVYQNETISVLNPDGGCCSWGHVECYLNRVSTLRLEALGILYPPTTLPFLLESILLSNNNITGPLPDTWGDNGPRTLLSIELAGNGLTGFIPNSFSKFPKLSSVLLRDNKLSGDLYPDLWRNAALQLLDLSNNGISGFTPSAFRFMPAESALLENNLFWYEFCHQSSCRVLCTIPPGLLCAF